jgi:hypothetical protein
MKKRPHILLAVIAAALLALPVPAAQIDGSGRPATQSRAVHDIYGIAVSVPAEVTVTQGHNEGLSITADDNLLAHIETVVENGVLRIRPRDQASLTAHTPIRVAVTARSPQLLAVSGSARIAARSLVLGRVEAKISGSGRIEVSGATPDFTAHIAGAGEVDAARLAAQDGHVAISGSGRIRLSAQRNVSASISGSGDIGYYGDPKVEKSVAGSGRIHRLGDHAG